MIAPLLLAVLPGIAPQEPVPDAVLGGASVVAAAGDWLATIEVLPVPEAMRRFHAPRAPWRLGRVFQHGGELEVALHDGASRSGWGAPSWVAIAGDGTIVVTWRPGRRIVVCPPNGPSRETLLEMESGFETAHLDSDLVVHSKDTADGGLELVARRTLHDGLGEPFELGPARFQFSTEFLRDGDRLVWCRDDGTLAHFHVPSGKIREIACPDLDEFDMDGVVGDWLYLHTSMFPELPHRAAGEARLLNLVDGTILRMPVARTIDAFGPEGIRTSRTVLDPVTGARRFRTLLGKGDPPRAPEAVWPLSHPTGRLAAYAEERPANFVPRDADEVAAQVRAALDAGERSAVRGIGRFPWTATDAYVAVLDRLAREALDPNDRRAGIQLLGNVEGQRSVPVLLALFDDEDEWWERIPIAQALSRVGDASLVPRIVAGLPMEEAVGRQVDQVALLLAMLGGDVATTYVAALQEEAPSGRVTVCLEMLRERTAFDAVLRAARPVVDAAK